MMNYALCWLIGFITATLLWFKLEEEHEKSIENLLQAHREYEEALKSGYEYFKKVAADKEENILQLTGGRNNGKTDNK